MSVYEFNMIRSERRVAVRFDDVVVLTASFRSAPHHERSLITQHRLASPDLLVALLAQTMREVENTHPAVRVAVLAFCERLAAVFDYLVAAGLDANDLGLGEELR